MVPAAAKRTVADHRRPAHFARWAFLALLAAVPLLAGLWWSTRPPRTHGEPGWASASGTAPSAAGAAMPTPEPDSDAPAKLSVDFEHPLRSGTMKLWIDDELVLEQTLEGHVTRSVPGTGLKLRKGGFEEEFEVAPGRHNVAVEVSWDDNVKRESIAGTFKGGGTRRLEARIGRLRKGLSLDWR